MATVDEVKIIVKAEADAAIAKMKQLEQTNKSNSKTGVELAKSIAGYTNAYGLAIQAGQAVLSTFVDLAKQSVTLAASFEKSRMSWGVFLGSLEAGNEMFDRLQSFAAKTPLAFEGVNQAAITLKGFGVEAENIIPTMSRLGDIAQGDNAKLSHLALVFGQVKAQGKAMTQDLYQFVNAGVPIFDLLSKSMNRPVSEMKDLAAQSKITFSDIENAIKLATSEGGQFYGMMEQTAQSAAGKWSTAQDNFNIILADFGAKILPMVNAALDTFNASMDKMQKNKNLGAAFEKGSAIGSENLKEAIKTLEKEMKDLGYTGQKSLSGIGEAYAEQLSYLKQSLAFANAFESKQKAIADSTKKVADQKAKSAEEEVKAAEKAKKIADEQAEKLKDIAGKSGSAYRSIRLVNDEYNRLLEVMRSPAEAKALEALENADYSNATEYLKVMQDPATVAALEAFENTDWNAPNEELPKAVEGTQALINGLNTIGGMKFGSIAEQFGLIEVAGKTSAQKIEEAYSTAFGTITGYLSAYSDLVKNRGDLELAQMKANGATEEEIAKKRNELARRAFNAQKDNAIAQALINGALAVTKALADLGPIVGPIMAGISGAATIAQIATIQQQQYIPMASGGAGVVTKPTLFLAGEKGPEPFAFGGAGNRLGLGLGGGTTTVVNNYYSVVNQNVAGSIRSERELKNLAVAGVSKAGRGY